MNWPTAKIGDVADVVPGFAFKSKELTDGGVPLVKIGNIQDDGRVDLENTQCLPQNLLLKKHEKYRLDEGDVILAMTGATAGKAGRMRRLNGELPLLNQRVAKFIPREVNPDFLWFAIGNEKYRAKFYGLGGGAAQPNMSGPQIADVEIPFPSIETQERIASTLAAYDDLIENNRRRIVLLEEAARLLYREWFVHFRFPGHEHVKIIDGVPEEWERGTIDDLFKTSSGGTPSRKKPEFYGGDINWLKTQEMNDGFVFFSDEKITEEGLKGSSAKLFPKNTVVVAMYGATIGRLCILANPSTTNQACCALLPKFDEKDYLFGFSMMDYYAKTLKDRGQGAAQNNVSQHIIKSFEILIPSRDFISGHNELVKPIFEQQKVLQAQSAQLEKARDLLLPRLMDGRLEV